MTHTACARRRQHGQATVELALSLPVVMLLVLAVVQVGLLVADDVTVVAAAREAARAAAVDADPAAPQAAATAATGLSPARLSVERGPRGSPGDLVAVTVHYRAPTEVPLIGPLLPDAQLTATARMRVEQ